ncbi:MAG: glycosyltransferase family 4 protein [Porphyromonadaceae bacterium]|nr:glycosyltransferase family 4 protein [Porphyromonadaceae bacterium]
MTKIPVVYVINALPKLGPVLVLEGLIRSIDRRKFTPIIICLRGKDPKGYDDVFAKMGISIHYLHRSFLELELMTLSVARQVARLVDLHKARIVHAHGYHPDLVVSHLPKRLVRISTQHNISRADFTFGKGKWLGRYMDARLWFRLKRIDVIVGITDYVAGYCIDRLGNSSTSVETILNGVDTSAFRPLPDEARRELRRRLFPSVSTEAVLWIVCGSLSKLKDPLLIIRAFVYLLSVGAIPRDSVLALIGQGELEDECRKATLDLEQNVQILGFRNNVADYLMVADALVAASRSEGFGLNVAEALVARVPVVATDLPVYRELMLHDTTLLNLLYPIGDAEALSGRLLVSREVKIPQELHQRLREHLSRERMAKQYEALYQQY